MAQIVSLDNSPNQTFRVSVLVNDVNVKLDGKLRYNETAGYWALTLADASTGTILVDSLPLLTGDYPAGDILGQYEYLGIGHAYVMNAAGSILDHPDDETLGTDFLLVFDS